MAIIMGPVLKFVGTSSGIDGDQTQTNKNHFWHISVLIVVRGDDHPAMIEWTVDETIPLQDDGNGRSPAERLIAHQNCIVYRYRIPVRRGPNERRVQYWFDQVGEKYTFYVPALEGDIAFAFASCNGFSEPGLMKDVSDHNALWQHMWTIHDHTEAVAQPYMQGEEIPGDGHKRRFHLLLMGGDQVYADSIWQDVEDLGAWASLKNEKADKESPTSEMLAKMHDFYCDLYIKRWAKPARQRSHFAALMARIPTLMMWDDHDIIDGWGSYSDSRNSCPVFQALFNEARFAFNTFQQQDCRSRDPLLGGYLGHENAFNLAHVIDDIGILALDMRSERSRRQVISKHSWDAIQSWLDKIAGDDDLTLRHLIIMSSIPVVHASLGFVEKILKVIPKEQELEDDLLDHWNNHAHEDERTVLVHRLLRFARRKKCRVTILSGDVHVGALGTIEDNRNARIGNERIITQLTSSGIVHPPPPGLVRYGIETLFTRDEDEIDRDVIGKLHPPGGGSDLFIGRRNWLSLEIDAPNKDPQRRIWAKWWVEGALDMPRVKVIHPVDAKQREDA